jgi:hypothetical protein
MRFKLHIRPRAWQPRGAVINSKSVPAFGWRPLSLIFRRQRPRRPSEEKAARPPVSSELPAPIVRMSSHLHYHTHQGTRTVLPRAERAFAFAPLPVRNVELRLLSSAQSGPQPARITEQLTLRQDRILSHERLESRSRSEREESSVVLRHVTRWRMLERSVTKVASEVGRASERFESQPPPASASRVASLRRPSLRLQAGSMVDSGSDGMVRAPVSRVLSAPAAGLEAPMARHARRNIAAAKPESPPQVVFRRPHVSMVWRKEQPRAEALGASSIPAQVRLSADAPRAAPNGSAVPLGGAVLGTPSPGLLKLDGPAIDRLAEDVMQRIDRRIRIERERRGM